MPGPNGKANTSRGVAMMDSLRAGKDYTRECQWPGTDGDTGRYVLVPLSVDELQCAYSAAGARFKDLEIKLDIHSSDDFYSELNLQVVARAMRDPNDPGHRKHLFANCDELRSFIRTEERDAITTEYLTLQTEVDPSPDDLGNEIVNQIDDAVKKKDVLRLAAFSSSILGAYLIGMADPSAS